MRRRVTPSSGNRPLAVLRGRMRRLQREAEAALEKSGLQSAATRLRSFQERSQANQLGEERSVQSGAADREGRAERLLSGIERELTRRLKSVLERLDLPNRRELQALDERIRGLEKRVSEQLSTERITGRKASRRKRLRR
jgi:hypothetical protein